MNNRRTDIVGAGYVGSPAGFSIVPTQGFYARFGKRMFDIFAGLVLLVTTLPIMLLIALCLFVTIGKPLFSHERVGQNRRTFGCLKFRTMTVDAPRLLRLILRTNVNAANE